MARELPAAAPAGEVGLTKHAAQGVGAPQQGADRPGHDQEPDWRDGRQDPRVRAQLFRQAVQQQGPQAQAAQARGPHPQGPQQPGQDGAEQWSDEPEWSEEAWAAQQEAYPEQQDVSPWFAAPGIPESAYDGAYNPMYVEGLEPTPVLPPSGPADRGRSLGGGPGVVVPEQQGRPKQYDRRSAQGAYDRQGDEQYEDQPYGEQQYGDQSYADQHEQHDHRHDGQYAGRHEQHGYDDRFDQQQDARGDAPRQAPNEGTAPEAETTATGTPGPGAPDDRAATDDIPREEAYYNALRKYISEYNDIPNERQFGRYLLEMYDFRGRAGGPLSEKTLRAPLREAQRRFQEELDSEHIA